MLSDERCRICGQHTNHEVINEGLIFRCLMCGITLDLSDPDVSIGKEGEM